jgi:hypothetical protein
MSVVLEIPVTQHESKVFSIDPEHLSFHDLQMDIADITGFCYGRIINTSAGMPAGGSHHYKFEDTSGDIIGFGFQDGPLINGDTHTSLTISLENAVWEYLGNHMLNRLVREIHNGKEIRVGELLLNRGGIHVTPHEVYRPPFVIPWEYAIATAQNGSLVISSVIRGEDICSLPLRTTMNAHVLYRILYYMQNNVYLRDVLRGINPPLA